MDSKSSENDEVTVERGKEGLEITTSPLETPCFKEQTAVEDKMGQSTNTEFEWTIVDDGSDSEGIAVVTSESGSEHSDDGQDDSPPPYSAVESCKPEHDDHVDDMSSSALHDSIIEDLGRVSYEKKFPLHKRNISVNNLLNLIVLLSVAVVFGIAIGHYSGFSDQGEIIHELKRDIEELQKSLFQCQHAIDHCEKTGEATSLLVQEFQSGKQLCQLEIDNLRSNVKECETERNCLLKANKKLKSPEEALIMCYQDIDSTVEPTFKDQRSQNDYDIVSTMVKLLEYQKNLTEYYKALVDTSSEQTSERILHSKLDSENEGFREPIVGNRRNNIDNNEKKSHEGDEVENVLNHVMSTSKHLVKSLSDKVSAAFQNMDIDAKGIVKNTKKVKSYVDKSLSSVKNALKKGMDNSFEIAKMLVKQVRESKNYLFEDEDSMSENKRVKSREKPAMEKRQIHECDSNVQDNDRDCHLHGSKVEKDNVKSKTKPYTDVDSKQATQILENYSPEFPSDNANTKVDGDWYDGRRQSREKLREEEQREDWYDGRRQGREKMRSEGAGTGWFDEKQKEDKERPRDDHREGRGLTEEKFREDHSNHLHENKRNSNPEFRKSNKDNDRHIKMKKGREEIRNEDDNIKVKTGDKEWVESLKKKRKAHTSHRRGSNDYTDKEYFRRGSSEKIQFKRK